MKFVVFFCLLAVAFALPNRDAVALRDDRNIEADGSHSYAYEIDNGIRVSEEGRPVTNGAISKTGEIRFTSPEGVEFVLTYVADENGFRATSPFLPTLQRQRK